MFNINWVRIIIYNDKICLMSPLNEMVELMPMILKNTILTKFNLIKVILIIVIS